MSVVDLFCGCGGMSLGFQKAGFCILAGFEHWDAAISCYKKNFTHPVEDVDLSNVEAAVKAGDKAAAEAMIAEFEKELGRQAQSFAVTYAFELKVDGWGKENQPLHFFMVKANCNSFVDGVIYDSVTMAIDYDTGAVYDRYSVDESWMEKSEKEQAIYIAAEGGCFPDEFYSGEPIFVDSETHISLSDSDIAEINQALRK